jgi:hypothetical protein
MKIPKAKKLTFIGILVPYHTINNTVQAANGTNLIASIVLLNSPLNIGNKPMINPRGIVHIKALI